jgi:DNA-binding protein WhiA
MGFSRAFREELARVEDRQACCRLAAVSGLVHTAGTLLIKGGASDQERYEIRVATTVPGAAKMVYSEFKALGAEGQLFASREPRFRHRLVYEVRVPGTPAALQALNEMGVLTDSFDLRPGIAPWIVKKGCCRSAFLRGCLLGTGSANMPQKQAHLEIITPHEDLCRDLARLLSEMDFHPGWSARRGSYVLYLKARDEVAGLLALAGAYTAALAVEEQAVLKEVRGRANRVANCDSANVRRTGAAASRQLEAISALERSGRLGALPTALRDMAALRLEHPYMNLSELAEAGGQGLTRSAINHRLRRLLEAAEQPETAKAHGRIRDQLRA